MSDQHPDPAPDPAAEYIRKVNTEVLLTFYVALRQYLTAAPPVAEDIANARAAIAAFGGREDITLAELTTPPLSDVLNEADVLIATGRVSPALTAAEDQIEAALRDRDG
jgi:hypothetical protein